MIITQTVDIPADRRVFLELPHSVPVGIKAQVEINIPAVSIAPKATITHARIEDIRQLLQKEMIEKGTSAVFVATGDGWEAHIRERYAKS